MRLGNLKIIFIFFYFFCFSVFAQPIEGKKIQIQILDKITAKVDNFIIEVNNELLFGSLIIEIFTCFKNPPEEIPENFVLLRISDKINKNKNNKKLVYQGWMISSSPASTPLEHPIYDLWLKDCII